MHAQVVDHYFDRYKRVILAGDAAHRFPPAGGFGEYLSLHIVTLGYLAKHCGNRQ